MPFLRFLLDSHNFPPFSIISNHLLLILAIQNFLPHFGFYLEKLRSDNVLRVTEEVRGPGAKTHQLRFGLEQKLVNYVLCNFWFLRF